MSQKRLHLYMPASVHTLFFHIVVNKVLRGHTLHNHSHFSGINLTLTGAEAKNNVKRSDSGLLMSCKSLIFCYLGRFEMLQESCCGTLMLLPFERE